MFRYFLKRILIFVPVLLIISLVAFSLSKMTPGDPVLAALGSSVMEEKASPNYKEVYREKAMELGLDKPVFYGSFQTKAYPDTLYKIFDYIERANLKKLIAQYGNWPEIEQYFQNIRTLDALSYRYLKSGGDPIINIRRELQYLYTSFKDEKITIHLDRIDTQIKQTDSLSLALQKSIGAPINRLIESYETIKSSATPGLGYIPSFRWHGANNQYHSWVKNAIQLDFGNSYRTRDSVWVKLKTPLFWTLLLNALALFLSFLIAIPIGILSAVWKSSFFDRVINIILFLFYALPTFWIATMLVFFFTTKGNGTSWTDIFPSIGMGRVFADDPFWTRFWIRAPHLILPVICLVYPTLAFIARQVRGGMLDVLEQDYIRTAHAKGLSEKVVIIKHALRNALFPIISMLAIAFPALLAGSVVIEVIFIIPGLGFEIVESISAKDWPVVFTILLMTAVFTLVANFIADILYTIADPRVSFGKKM